MSGTSSVSKLYYSVVEDVLSNVRETFLDDGVDEQVLEELKQLWTSKLNASKALDDAPSKSAEALLQGTYLQAAGLTLPGHHAVGLPTTIPQLHQQTMAAVQLPTQQVSADLSGAASTATMALPAGVFQQQLAALAAQGYTIQQTSQGQYIAVQTAQPIQHTGVQQAHLQQAQLVRQQQLSQQQLQQQQQLRQQAQNQQASHGMVQLDGPADDTSSEEDDDDDNDNNEDEAEEQPDEQEEEEPLNSADDISDDDPNELFDTDNVVVCQYDKINRCKNKWKFHLKDGIMNLAGKDHVFQKATGDSEW